MTGIACAGAAALLLLSSSVWAQQPAQAENPQIAQQLADAKKLVDSLRSDLATLDFLARAEGGITGNASVLDLLNERIAALQTQATKLNAARASGSPSQQTAVERVAPILEDFATTAEAVSKAVKANQNPQNLSAFRQYMKLNAELADEYSTLISAWIHYAETRSSLDSVAREIGAPAADSR